MSATGAGRYLAFELASELFAIEVERVEVVLDSATITRVPKAPAHLRGVINYRGVVIPVADLRVRFGEAPSSTANGVSIVVLQIHYGSENLTIGVLADKVHEVIDLDVSHIERAPKLGAKIDDALIAGIGQYGDRFIVILDIDEAFKAEAADRTSERSAETQ